MNNWIGKQIGKCILEDQVGAGGMGTVYKARHMLLDKVVALKVLHSELLRGDIGREIQARFLREAQSAAQLEHSNVIPIYDVGVEDGIYYIVMQFVPGETLSDIIDREKKLAPGEVLWIVREMAKGLQAAHQKGIIHRDIKPANTMIAETGEVKIADFGLAKQVDDTSHLSQVGRVFGTPLYLSPEQATGEQDLDGRADLYSLGVTAYNALVGIPPYLGKTSFLVMQQHVCAPLPSLREKIPGIPEAIEYMVHKLMAKNREDRFASAADLVAYIEECNVHLLPKFPPTRRLERKKQSHESTKRLPKMQRFFESTEQEPQKNLPKIDLFSQNTMHRKASTRKIRVQIGESGVECIPEDDDNALEVNPGALETDTLQVETQAESEPSVSPQVPNFTAPECMMPDLPTTASHESSENDALAKDKVRIQWGPQGVEFVPENLELPIPEPVKPTIPDTITGAPTKTLRERTKKRPLKNGQLLQLQSQIQCSEAPANNQVQTAVANSSLLETEKQDQSSGKNSSRKVTKKLPFSWLEISFLAIFIIGSLLLFKLLLSLG